MTTKSTKAGFCKLLENEAIFKAISNNIFFSLQDQGKGGIFLKRGGVSNYFTTVYHFSSTKKQMKSKTKIQDIFHGTDIARHTISVF